MIDYIQTSDPGAVGAGKSWLHTTTQDWKIRDANNAAWILIGNLAQTRAGNVPVSGGVLSGPITGSHGLAELDAPDFVTSAKVEGKTLARMADLAKLRTDILSNMNTRMQELIARSTGSPVVNNVAFAVVDYTISDTGPWPTPTNVAFTIALPYYPDGTQAKASEIRGYGAALKQVDFSMAVTAMHIRLIEITAGSRQYGVNFRNESPTGGSGVATSWILCTR